jgi:DNA-binding HxlR family transcriptional regulator
MDRDVEQGTGPDRVGTPRDAVQGATSVAGLLARRWVVPIVMVLRDGPRRRFQLAIALRGVSAKVLTETLRHLEGEGIVERQLVRESDAVGAGYALTPRGRALDELISALAEWWTAHDVLPPREQATG